MGVGGQRHAPAALPPGRRPGTHCIGGWLVPSPDLDGCENLALTGIRSPERPARSESLYGLSYPGRQANLFHDKFVHTDEQTLRGTNAILQLIIAAILQTNLISVTIKYQNTSRRVNNPEYC